MEDLWPLVRAHALGAGAFGALVAVLYYFLPGMNWVFLGLAVAYIVVLNRYVARLMPRPPFARPRKGSHKPPKNAGWQITGWVLRTTAVGMLAQISGFGVAFVIVYEVLRALLR